MVNTRKSFKLTPTNKDKRIAELEKVCQDLSDKFDYQVKQVMKLEKEKAELKESGSVICDRLSERIDETVELKNENIGLKNQLTKAKELLKNFVALDKDYDWNLQLAYEAEQFLKEIK